MHIPHVRQPLASTVTNAGTGGATAISLPAVRPFASNEKEIGEKPVEDLSTLQKKVLQPGDRDDELQLKARNETSKPELPLTAFTLPNLNKTGLPDNLKSGVEQLSGFNMDDVTVHYSSGKPSQLKALAYAQGADIHVGPGQEKYLPHEAWHVVQQKQGRVQPNTQTNGMPVNDDEGLENEATLMGNKALSTKPSQHNPGTTNNDLSSTPTISQRTVQRAVGFEFEDGNWNSFAVQPGKKFRKPFAIENYLPINYDVAPVPSTNDKLPGENIYKKNESSHINQELAQYNLETAAKKGEIHSGPNYKIEPDGPYESGRMDIEFVTRPFDETDAGYKDLVTALGDMMSVVLRLSSYTGRDYKAGSFVEPAEHKFTDQEVYLSGGTPGGGFKVQATQGLPLSKIPLLMKILGSDVPGEKKDEKESRDPYRELVRGKSDSSTIDSKVVGSAPAIAEKAVKNLFELNVIKSKEGIFGDAPADVGALQGFISLMVMYMQMMTYVGSQGIKEKLPLMSRYSFATLFKQLPENQQRDIIMNSGAFVLALEASLSGTRADKMSDPMLSSMAGHTLWDEPGKKQAISMFNALQSITRESWINAIFAGRDLLSTGDLMNLDRDDATPAQKAGTEEYGKSMGVFLRGHGNASRVIDNGKQDLAILENRSITTTDQKEMSIYEAYDFATKYFTMLKLINAYSSVL